MKILVAHGSERGGTAEIAAQVGAALRERGWTVDVLPAREVRTLDGYDAVVVGGALYAFRWHADAQRFVLLHARALRDRPVWFFSSGPLDDSARGGGIPPTPQVQELMDFVCAKGHSTFGGRLKPDAQGFIASKMARKHAGDWRDPASIAAWASGIAAQLRAPGDPGEFTPRFKPLPSQGVPVVLGLAVGISAIAGGGTLVVRPDGSVIHLSPGLLIHSPFRTFLVPGLLLVFVVGGINLWAVALQIQRSTLASVASLLGGSALLVWITTEMLLLHTMHWLQVTYFALAVSLVVTAMREARAMIRAMTPPHGWPGPK